MLRLARNAALVATLALPAAALADDAPTASASSAGGVTNIHSSKSLGVGFGAGAFVSGITAKKFLGDNMAVQGFLGTWFGYSWNVGADVMYQGKQLWGNSEFGLNWEAGVGAGAYLWSGAYAGYSGVEVAVNGVIGLSLQYRPIPVEITADIRPTFFIGSNMPGFNPFNGGGAVRYYF
jgi:hypothetical protein